MGMDNYSLSDLKAVTGSDNGSSMADNWVWIIILFLFRGGLFGEQGGSALTRAEMTEGFNNQSVLNKLDGISNGLCDGFYAQNTTMLQGFNTQNITALQSTNSIMGAIKDAQFAAQQCCCETNRNIDSVKAEAYKNTCDITTAIHSEGEQTRALINANTMQALRDKLADRDRDLQTANFQLSQQAQSAALVQELRPCAKPAYLTCSPYATNTAMA